LEVNTYYKNNNVRLYQCDNLLLLKQLPDNYIDLIYCDILYNTGKKFKDYNDNLGNSQQAMDWYKPRLIEMKRILKDTGSIYIQCDYRLIHYLKVEMDKIFGENNFLGEIIWDYGSGRNMNKSWFGKKHDNILHYSKTDKYIFNIQYQPIKEKSKARYNQTDENGLKYASVCKNGKYSKIYLKEEIPITDVWYISTIRGNSKESAGYDTQKPKELISKLIKAGSNENQIVADFFMGSGTTGEVALELNRKFIGCDIGERACQISKERIQHIVSN